MKISIKFEWRDIWIGVYPKRPRWIRVKYKEAILKYQIFVCLIPMLPIEISWTRKPKWLKEHLENDAD